ncbi:hypothetical protein [Perlucidibaca piscinae]|uniref:hypothetical protein n=1 Tax=Perlucidibaca piscinae TaxID=392589 RepID=UPI0003B3D3B4|nr:hypothetical protein [Perlucidibaca piscinae]
MELKTFFAQDTGGNVIAGPTAYLYEPGTTTLVTGMVDKDGDPLANPFTGTVNGLIQFAAPDGKYDLRVTGAGRDFTIRVQFLDASDVVAAAEAARDATQDAQAAAEDAEAGAAAAAAIAIATHKSTANTFTKAQSVSFVGLTDGANIAVDASLSNNFKVTLGGNRTLDNPTNLADGQVLNFRVKQDGSGSKTLAYGNKYKFPGGAPTLTTTASAIDLISCVYDSVEDKLFCSISKGMA